jgi:DUF1680 family protein
MQLTDPAKITLSGELNERLQKSIRHLLKLNTEEMWRELENPDEIWHWGADYPGRWIAIMALLGLHTDEDYGARLAAKRLIGYQQPDGKFGHFTSPTGYKEWFGMGRGLIGLLEYYVASGDGDALAAARRIGDYYIEHYPTFEPYMYECYSNALEGLVLLHHLTEDTDFLTIARNMADSSMVFQHIWQSSSVNSQGRRSPCGGQVHCQLTAARGLLDLHELTGELRYFTPVIALHDHICRETLSIAGGVGFYFNRPEENEACADADWLRLNLQLWRITSEERYLELAEQSLVNQIPFVQAANGAYCYMRGLQNRSGAAFDVCCSHHAPRAIWEVMRYAFTTEPNALSVNLHLDATARVQVSDQELTVELRRVEDATSVGLDATLRDNWPAQFALRVRVPTWAEHAELSVNGQHFSNMDRPGFVSVDRVWGDGDRLTVRFPNRVSVIRGRRLGMYIVGPEDVAVMLGPRVVCLSDLHNSSVNQDLVRLRVQQGEGRGITVCNPDRLEAHGVTPNGDTVPLAFTPISATGGNPNGIGRSHPALASPFRTWIPAEDAGGSRGGAAM